MGRGLLGFLVASEEATKKTIFFLATPMPQVTFDKSVEFYPILRH